MRERRVPVVYEDEMILVCEKPIGMPVQGDHSRDMDVETSIRHYLYEKQEGDEEFVQPRRVALAAHEVPVLADGVGELLLPADAAPPGRGDQVVAQGFSAEQAAGEDAAGSSFSFSPSGDLAASGHEYHLFLFSIPDCFLFVNRLCAFFFRADAPYLCYDNNGKAG